MSIGAKFSIDSDDKSNTSIGITHMLEDGCNIASKQTGLDHVGWFAIRAAISCLLWSRIKSDIELLKSSFCLPDDAGNGLENVRHEKKN